MSPDAIRAFIADPRAVRPATRMPNALHAVPENQRREVIEDLVHFLASQRSADAAEPVPTEVLPDDLKRGEQLFRTIGCAACHGANDLQFLARETWHAALARFLRDPLATHPGGLMPDMHLSADDAAAIAAFLLREQAADDHGAVTPVRAPGLRTEYFERPMSNDGVPDSDHAATRVFVSPQVRLCNGHREDDFALHFAGEIEIPTTGDYVFYIGSDDGSMLSIDDQVVIDNGGPHSFSFKQHRMHLDAGWHPIKVRYWEITIDNDLRLDWKGPDFAREEVPAARLAHSSLRLDPKFRPLSIDAQRAARGGEHFKSLGCIRCHADAPPSEKPFDSLDPNRGCLASDMPAGAPSYALSDAERTSLRELVGHASALGTPLEPKDAVTHAMQRLGCVACHVRGELGPPRERDAIFTADGSAELGDQGRLPPRLDGVGDKLRPEALAAQLDEGTKIRPYMRTRMPRFGGDALKGLATAFVAADHDRQHDLTIPFSPESAIAGRTLVGSGGVSCITCHTVNGRASLGVPAVDLGTMNARLRPGWFVAFLENPPAFSPGTRMTRFWLPNERIFPQVCGGDALKQRGAIWNYLSLRDAMPTPPGLAVTAGEYELVPGATPILFGTFMRDVSPRTVCVGYPDLVHVAFDAQHGRLAKAWRGAFMNAKGTWDGRAGQLESPLSKSTIDLPPGPAFAVLSGREVEWPSGGIVYRGMSLDAERRPAFALTLAPDDVAVNERPMPVLRPGGAWLRRAIEATANEDRTDVYMLAASGRTIEPLVELGRGGFLVDGAVRVATDADGAFVRRAGDHMELLIPIDFKYVEGAAPQYRASFAVDMDW